MEFLALAEIKYNPEYFEESTMLRSLRDRVKVIRKHTPGAPQRGDPGLIAGIPPGSRIGQRAINAPHHHPALDIASASRDAARSWSARMEVDWQLNLLPEYTVAATAGSHPNEAHL